MLQTYLRKMVSRRHLLVTILSVLVSYQCYCEDSYLLLCEGQEKPVSCPNDFIINIVSATYGYNGSNEEARQKCDDWWNSWFRDTDNTDCHLPESTNILTDKCNGHSECTVTANNEIFGDPCRGTVKYFELFYNCKQEEEDHVTTGLPDEEDNSDVDVTPGEGNDETAEGEMKDNSGHTVFVVAMSAGILVTFIVVIFLVRLVYFLQNKRCRSTRGKENNEPTFKRNNVGGSLNLEYETVGSSGNNPTTQAANQLPHYESAIHVNSNNFEYDYAVETGFVSRSEPQATYLNVK